MEQTKSEAWRPVRCATTIQERERTPAEEHRRQMRMDRWARRYDALNGAPESESDR